MNSKLPVNVDIQDIWQKDKDHVIHPWTDFTTFKEEGSLIMSKGENVFVYDIHGNKYLDGIGGLWCVNVGYGRQEIADAVSAQIMELPYFSPFGHQTTAPAAKLAAKLAEHAPESLNHVFFGCGGSVANDTAVRLIHHYFHQIGQPSKKKLIARKDAYHGSTYISMSLTGIEADHIGFEIHNQLVHHVSCPNPYRKPESQSMEDFCNEKVQELEDTILALGPDNVAAFFAEPIMGAGGVIVSPEGYHVKTLAVCKKYNVLYVSDEVVTAFGRLGHMFASEKVFGIVPDIITCAKGLSSGYLPLGATIISDEIYDAISKPHHEGGLLTHGFTYSGHPVSCVAALKNIEIIERENICEHVQDAGVYFEQQLKTLSDLEIVGEVRGKKFMMCIENLRNKETKELFDGSIGVGKRIANHCQKLGLIVRPVGHMNVLSPPLILTREQIDFTVKTLRHAIQNTIQELKAEGHL